MNTKHLNDLTDKTYSKEDVEAACEVVRGALVHNYQDRILKLASALEHVLNFAPAVKRRPEQYSNFLNLISEDRESVAKKD